MIIVVSYRFSRFDDEKINNCIKSYILGFIFNFSEANFGVKMVLMLIKTKLADVRMLRFGCLCMCVWNTGIKNRAIDSTTFTFLAR